MPRTAPAAPIRHSKIVTPKAEAIYRLPDVQRLTGYGRSAIYKFMAAGKFPQPVHLGPRAVGWREADIIAWQNSRPARSPDTGRRPGAKPSKETRAAEG
ncbi:MAG: AlpA family transcriptional regulator [Hyphomicrobiaceae bacterium]